MNQIPLWKQYGYSSEKEFRDRYPLPGRTQQKQTRSKRTKGKSRRR